MFLTFSMHQPFDLKKLKLSDSFPLATDILEKRSKMSQNSSSSDPPIPVLQDEAKYDFKNVPAQALDALRMRLAQLTHSLAKIRDEMSRADLPQWYSLQAQLSVTLTQLSSLTSTLQHFEDTLDSTVVFPLPNFPTTAHEGLLTTLLRKKNIPEVEDWIKDAKDTAGIDVDRMSEQEIEELIQKDKELTDWALEFVEKERSNHAFHGLHTAKELEQGMGKPAHEEYRSSAIKNKPSKPFSTNKVLKFVYQGDTD